jgi:N-acetylglutamate synthase-like GNAT family acetyltransferase
VVRVIRINRSHPLYAQEVELRQRVLLDPIGYSMERFAQEFPGFEERFEHFVAVISHPSGDRVIGCVVLLPHYPDPGIGKLMQMAVDPQRQREGIGKTLVAALERRAFGELGLVELYCHARKDAIAFYQTVGWNCIGDRFQEAGVEHSKMVFQP